MTKEQLLAILLEYQQFTQVDEVMSAFPSNRLMSFFRLDINAPLRDSDKYTTLHFAAVFGHKKLIEKLANHHQIKFDVRDSNGDTPLHLVAKGRLDDIAILSTLIDADKSNKVDYQNDQGRTPLYYAITKRHRNSTRFLLEHKASTTIQDKFGNTPLHAAVISGDIEILKTVLLFSQNGIIKNNKDMTPLEVAVYMNSVEAFNLLLPFSNNFLELV